MRINEIVETTELSTFSRALSYPNFSRGTPSDTLYNFGKHRSENTTSTSRIMSDTSDTTEVVLRDLQSLLRQHLGDEVILERYTTKSLVPPGENYGSTLVKLEAVIRRNEASEEENLQLVAKMVPATELLRTMFNSPFTFRKEIFMYEGLMPEYHRLEMELGKKKDEVFNILPKLYGSRLCLGSGSDFDENAVILMENLITEGYSCGDKRVGLDLDHAKMTITALARFHSLAIAMKFKKPILFQNLLLRCKPLGYNKELFAQIADCYMAELEGMPETNIHYFKFEKFVRMDQEAWMSPPAEPWGTIGHNDFWVNNIMFHHDESGKPDDIRFVDFQNYVYMNPVRELIFLLFASCTQDVRLHHFEELVHLYHETFLLHLMEMECDVSDFSWEKFDEQIRINAKFEFIHCMIMLKVMLIDSEDDAVQSKSLKDIFFSKGNEAYKRRIVELTEAFAKRNWL